MSMIDIQNPPEPIELGKTGENLFRTLEFDVSAWLAEYPNGVVSILFERPDGVVYPVLINATESPACWMISAEDLCASGEGRVEIQITDEEIVGKSVAMRTRTYAGLNAADPTPAAARTDWLNTVLAAAQRAEIASGAAEQAALEAASAAGGSNLMLENTLEETIAGKALDAVQGKILADRIAGLEFGDMQANTYDRNNDGVVDAADYAAVSADSNRLGGELPAYYLAADGDASAATAAFSESAVRDNLSGGETLSAIFGKIKRFFIDLHAVAFSGNYADLSGKPNSFTSSTHAESHALGGSDVLTPADIGAGDMLAAAYDPTGVVGDVFLASNSKMTGYSMAISAEAVSAADSVETAIGKLEKGLDQKISAALASTSGNLAALTASGGITDSGLSAQIGDTVAAKMDKATSAVSGHIAVFDTNGQVVDGGEPSGGVTSVFGRVGAVVAAAGDYTAEQVGAAQAIHASAHASGGADAITPASIGAESERLQFTDTVVAASAFVADTTYEDFPFRAAIALTGVLATMTPEVVLSVADAISGNYAPVAECYSGGVCLYAAEVPDAALTIPTIICWKAVG